MFPCRPPTTSHAIPHIVQGADSNRPHCTAVAGTETDRHLHLTTSSPLAQLRITDPLLDAQVTERNRQLDLKYGAEQVLALFMPVSLCMAVVVATIRSVSYFSEHTTQFLYTPFETASATSAGAKFGGAVSACHFSPSFLTLSALSANPLSFLLPSMYTRCLHHVQARPRIYVVGPAAAWPTSLCLGCRSFGSNR